MKICENCGHSFPNFVNVDGKRRNLHRRRYCLICSPFGARNTRLIPEGLNLSERREKNLAQRKKDSKVRVSQRRKELIQMAVESKGGKCQICGYHKCIAALEFHHLDRAQKLFGIRSNGSTMSWEKMGAELQKCVLLCANCHREVEANLPQTLALLSALKN